MDLQNEDKIKELTTNRSWGEEPSVVEEPEEETEEVSEEEPEQEAQVEEKEEAQEPEVDPEVERLRKESDGRLRELINERQNRAALTSELATLRESIEELRYESQPVEPLPDKEEDPAGYIEAVTDDAIADLREDLSEFQRTEQARRDREDVETVARASAWHEHNFRQEHTDYDQAYDYVANAYLNHFMQQGMTPEQANEQGLNLAYKASKNAMLQGQNPAEMVYAEAQRLGFKPAAVKVEPVAGVDKKTLEGAKRPTSLSSPSMAGTGNTPNQRKGVVTREWIFKNLSKAKRVELYKNPTFFRTLDEQGEAKLPKGFEID